MCDAQTIHINRAHKTIIYESISTCQKSGGQNEHTKPNRIEREWRERTTKI